MCLQTLSSSFDLQHLTSRCAHLLTACGLNPSELSRHHSLQLTQSGSNLLLWKEFWWYARSALPVGLPIIHPLPSHLVVNYLPFLKKSWNPFLPPEQLHALLTPPFQPFFWYSCWPFPKYNHVLTIISHCICLSFKLIQLFTSLLELDNYMAPTTKCITLLSSFWIGFTVQQLVSIVTVTVV